MLTIVAKITAEPGHGDRIQRALQALVPPTREEAGCRQYDLHKSIEDPDVFVFVENWADKESFDGHMNSQHLTRFLKENDAALRDLQIWKLDRIDGT